jgi:hypothetical protein
VVRKNVRSACCGLNARALTGAFEPHQPDWVSARRSLVGEANHRMEVIEGVSPMVTKMRLETQPVPLP